MCPPSQLLLAHLERLVTLEGDAQTSADTPLENAIKQLSADMHMMFSALDERLGKLEQGIEQRIANKFTQLLDKRVNCEMTKLRKEVDARLETFRDTLKEEMTAEIADINTKLQTLSTVPAPGSVPSHPDKSLNVVIRGLPSTNGENVADKVNTLIKDGLRINDVSCVSAERKRVYSDSKPGVVISSFRCHDDKRKVMQKKASLQKNHQHNKVFIDHNLSVTDRIISNNFRTILGALRDQNLVVRGTRVVHAGDHNRNHGRPRNDNQGDPGRHDTHNGPHGDG